MNGPLTPEDFPLTCYGSAVFRGDHDAPLFVMATRQLAESIALRLNNGECLARLVDAIDQENGARGFDDAGDVTGRIGRIIRGTATETDYPAGFVYRFGDAEEAAAEEPPEPGWTLPKRDA